VIVHEYADHALLKIELFVCFVLCLQVLHSWRKKNVGALFLLIWRMSLLVVWFLVFVLHDFLWDQGANWWTTLRNHELLLLFEGWWWCSWEWGKDNDEEEN
jgi:hypothetical protein